MQAGAPHPTLYAPPPRASPLHFPALGRDHGGRPPRTARAVTPGGPTTRYNFGFLGVSLRPDLARLVAELFFEEGSWEATRARILATNALQCRTRLTLRRIEQELRLRLSTLTPAELQLLITAAGPDRVVLAWLAALKQSTFLFDFAAEVLREKLGGTDWVLRYSDYETFLDTHVLTHPELVELRASTRVKLRQMLMHMLSEGALLHTTGKTVRVQRPLLGRSVLNLILSDDPRWLTGFLYTDNEVEALRCNIPLASSRSAFSVS